MTEHAAGRELDVLIAEKVIGWRWLDPPPDYPPGPYFRVPHLCPPGKPWAPSTALPKVPAYSTDMIAAWQVVERLAARGWEPSVTRWVQQPGITPHTSCYLERNEPDTGILLETYEATAEVTAPALAICRVALLAVGT